jgi:hypothetical protein
MFGEREGQIGRVLESLEVVTFCDHLGFLPTVQLKHELRGKRFLIALDPALGRRIRLKHQRANRPASDPRRVLGVRADPTQSRPL